MEPQVLDEKVLIQNFFNAKELLRLCEDSCSDAKKRVENLENQLKEVMETLGVQSTARYEGLGHVTLGKPKLYCSVRKENEDKLFEFLKANNAENLIKPSVNKSTLSAFIADCVKSGIDVPEIVNYYYRQNVLAYPIKTERSVV